MVNLSKSQYIRGLQCLKSLWLYKKKPELRAEQSYAARAAMNSGSDVGELAQQLFPGGALIEFDSSDFEGMLRRTQQLIDEGVKTIYEATFRGNGIFVMCDILHKGEEGWEVYEVKSSTSVKEYHRNDLSIQWYALESLGLPLTKASVVHINNQYCRGEELDLPRLFTITEITDEVVERQQQIPEKLNEMEGALSMEEPAIKIGGHCSSPFECDFSDHCWKNVAKESVFNIYDLSCVISWRIKML